MLKPKDAFTSIEAPNIMVCRTCFGTKDCKHIYTIAAPFNNTRTLNFKTQLMVVFFPFINPNINICTLATIRPQDKKKETYKWIEMHVMTTGGVLQISSDGDNQRIFWGLKIFTPGLFWVGKFGKYLFG